MIGPTQLEIDGWQFRHVRTAPESSATRWAVDNQRAHVIINLRASRIEFAASGYGLPYIGAPTPGEFSWIPPGAAFSGVYGCGHFAFLSVSPPTNYEVPRHPVFGGFKLNVLSEARELVQRLQTSDREGSIGLANRLWRRLLQGQPQSIASRRGTLLGTQQLGMLLRGMAEHPKSFRTTEQLAWQSGCSLDAINRTFLEAFGVTTSKALESARLRYARRELALDSSPIAEIARCAGYSSQAHLTTRMKHVFGSTPHELRQLLIGMPQDA